MKFGNYIVNPALSLIENASSLAKLMKSEREGHALSGYWFDFGGGEYAEHKNMSANMVGESCWAMVKQANKVRLFRNMNGQLAAITE